MQREELSAEEVLAVFDAGGDGDGLDAGIGNLERG